MLIIGRTSVGRRKQNCGFTLLELMIVVGIVAIIAAIAFPSYQDSVRKSNRADAKASLSEAAQRMQRCYTANNYDYDGCIAAPYDSGERHYRISAPTADADGFVVRADAESDIQKGDREGCLIFTLDHRGERGPQAAIDADCW